MDPNNLQIGDEVIASPMGAGTITGITSRGYPKVNEVAVAWLERTDGARFDPHNAVGGSRPALNAATQPVATPRLDGANGYR